MTAELLLREFERLSEAPGAVPKLRQFVLDLAVRGKLVTQVPSDPPACELLSAIEGKRRHAIAAGELRGDAAVQEGQVDEIPFAIPPSWRSIRLASLALKLGAGSTPLGGKTVYQLEGIPFIRSQNVHNDGLRLDDVARITPAVHRRMSGTHVQSNDILLNITGASIGRCAWCLTILVRVTSPSTLRLFGSSSQPFASSFTCC